MEKEKQLRRNHEYLVVKLEKIKDL